MIFKSDEIYDALTDVRRMGHKTENEKKPKTFPSLLGTVILAARQGAETRLL